MKNKGKKIRSFARRLTRRIMLTQLIVMGLAAYLIYEVAEGFIKFEEFDLYRSYLKSTQKSVESIMSDVYLGSVNHVSEIEAHLDKPDKLHDIMQAIVEQNPNIRSCGLSFIADYYPKKGRWFCPYAVRGEDGKIETKTIGDASHDYLNAEWFTEALEANVGYWSKPFFDATDSITPLAAYMLPIHDKQGKTVAILGSDMLLNSFNSKKMGGIRYNGDSVKIYIGNEEEATSANNFMNSDRKWRIASYWFIIDKDGTFVAHPDSSRVIRDNYFKCAKESPDSIDDFVGREMAAGKAGSYQGKKYEPQKFDFFDIDDMSVYMFYQPIKSSDWSIGLAVPSIMIDGVGIGVGIVMLIFIGLGMLVVRIVGRFFIKRATKPLKQLAQSADEVAKGNFYAPLPTIKHNDEIRLVRDSFEGMQHSLMDYMEELKTTTASKAAMENELKVAHDIQMSMLPKTFPPYPERDDIDIYGTLTPAKDVGGDLFDFYIREEQLIFCIGDVSGKGVPASLVMAVTRSLFRNISAHVLLPDHIVATLNNALASGNDNNMFVTIFVGVLDLKTGQLRYCNAGHDAPLLIGSEVTQLPCNPNLPAGAMPDMTFTMQETVISPQTTIFLYTDGLNEAENKYHNMFGMERVMRIAHGLVADGNNQPTEIVNAMERAVHNYVGEAEQSDDLTMLAIKYV